MRHIRWLVMLSLLLPVAARGQVASGTDILRGRVTDESGAPVAGAEVEVWAAESGVRRTATTNGQGWYTVTVPDGGGRYRMRVSRLGMTPVERTVARTGDEEVLTQDIRMAGRPVEVGGVTARGRRPAPSTRADAGAQSRGLSSDLTSRLPLENTDPAALASLAPGVVATGDSLGGGGSFSVLGQRASQNQVTLDGATFASLLSGGAPGGSPLGLPQEGVRSSQVVTNTYDVARGQFSGGQVAMTTRAGGNTMQGSLSYRLGDDLLQGGAGRGAWTDGFMSNRLSGGVSGPIVRDRLFYALSVAGQQRSDGLYALAPRAPEGFSVLGISADSAARFLDVAERVHGVSAAGQTGAFTRTSDALSTLARVDYSPTVRHTLSARGYTSHSRTSNALIRPLELLEGGGASSSRAFGVVGTLSSRLGDAWINELRASGSTDRREFTSALDVPEARVQVASALEAGTAVATLSFGGDPFPPRTTGERTLEVADELSLLLGGTHRVKLGATFGHTSFEQRDALGSNGIFTFASLADLEAGRAASYARTLAGATTEGSGWSAALYLGDTWRPTEGLQLVYGARVEGSGFGEAPARDAGAEAAFGLRTDRTPGELRVSPRLGFSWRVPGGRPRYLRGGVGEFRGRTPFSLYAGVLDAGRGAGGESFLSCVGAGRVPEADFRRFRADPASVPTTCADGSAGVPASGGRPNVTAFAPGFQAPRSWRASLGYEHTLRPRVVLSVDGFYLRGLGQYGVRDLNLAGAPAFTLDAEGGRPVYAPAAAIDPATGAVPLFGSRQDGRYAQAYEVHSGLRSESGAVTVALNGMLAGIRTNFQTSYTLSYSRDQSSFTFGGPREGFGWTMTRGDPNEPEWAPGDQDRRHSLSAVVGRPFGSAWEVSLIGRATSGAPYTPRVAGDINGDGAGNDAAFVFDPADGSLGAALGRVMEAAPELAGECLRENVGTLVRRNGCRGAWEYSLDTRVAFTPTLRTLGRRLSFGVDVRNLAAGADVLLHGSGGVRGWGQGGRVTDEVLLYPRGFDAATRSYRYQVNERFGQVRSRAAALGSPFTVQLTGRLQVGPNPEADLWGGFIGLGGREGGVRIVQQLPGPAPEGAATGPRIVTGQQQGGPSTLDRLLPLPIADILARRDSLGLTPEQVERLEAINKELEEKNIPIRAEVGAALGGRGGTPGNPGSVFEKVGPRINQGRLNVQAALDQARAVLTPAQWEKVPLEVRNAVDGSSIRIQGT
jgi:hypothetical protein